jgi:outer membrane receptor protein involved in Fe transport
MFAPSRFLVALSAILLVGGTRATTAQTVAAAPSRGPNAAGEIRGTLVEAGSARAVTAGSITVRRAGADTSFAGSALPRADGTFRVEGLTPGRYTLRVRALGYAPLVRTGVVVSPEQPVAELGALTLSQVATQLEGQVVVAEREEVALAPDRNSYSAKNLTTASGGTAVDVLRSVPSVEVDGTNNVSLRGNQNVVVQINGRSSPLKGEQLGNFLAQLPASSVKTVEVATNPSAKNDPEGTAGIINIVLNQEAEMGLSGGFTAGTGTTGLANMSANVGKQSGPLTLFLSGNFFRDSRDITGKSDRTNLVTTVPVFVESRFGGEAEPRSQNMTLRSEYKFTEHDALSLDAIVSGGRWARATATHYSDLDAARQVIGLFDQYNTIVARNLSQDYTMAFRRTGGPEATTFSTELRYNRNRNNNDTALDGFVRQSETSTATPTGPSEHDAAIWLMPSWNLQTDYTRPFNSRTKLESGFKATQRSTTNDFSAAFLDAANGTFVTDPTRATAFDYREQIGAVYSVLSQQIGKVQAQGGLRLEQASTRLAMPLTSERFDNHYASAFPSAILTYNVTDMRQAKVSYSRRISRPNPGQLSPVVWRDDARNIFHGNPYLSPEYTDALELALQETRGWGSVQLSPYLRKTAHAVRYIQRVDADGITVGTFDNVASTTTVGTDLNVTYRSGPLTLFTGGSTYHYSSDAANLAGNLSTNAFVWSVRANATWKFSPVTDLQMFANYRAPYATEGGSQTAFVFSNVAVRRKLWGDQGSVAVRVADPFNLMSYGFRTADGRVIELSERHFGVRGLFISVSRNFGQQLKLKPRQQDAEPQAAPGPGGP